VSQSATVTLLEFLLDLVTVLYICIATVGHSDTPSHTAAVRLIVIVLMLDLL